MVRGVSISIRRVADRPTLKVVFIAESSAEAIRNNEVISAILCHISKFFPRWEEPSGVIFVHRKQSVGTAARTKIGMRYTFVDIFPLVLYHLFSYLYTKILIRE